MSHSLPPQGHPARELFEVADLVAVSTGKVPVATELHMLRRETRELCRRNPAVRRATYFKVNPTNDQLELVSIGPRGGWKKEWVFGPITKATVLR